MKGQSMGQCALLAAIVAAVLPGVPLPVEPPAATDAPYTAKDEETFGTLYGERIRRATSRTAKAALAKELLTGAGGVASFHIVCDGKKAFDSPWLWSNHTQGVGKPTILNIAGVDKLELITTAHRGGAGASSAWGDPKVRQRTPRGRKGAARRHRIPWTARRASGPRRTLPDRREQMGSKLTRRQALTRAASGALGIAAGTLLGGCKDEQEPAPARDANAPVGQAKKVAGKAAEGGSKDLRTYVCGKCGYVYDPMKTAPPKSFADLPEDWKCPRCGSPKSRFSPKG
jgi:rubredoxin